MIKILYAASNNYNSKLQLSRFLEAVQNKPYQIKIAAYKDYCPDIHIDWTLDALYGTTNKYKIPSNLVNYNYDIYLEQVKSYNPDLVISDLDYFTSYIAMILGCQLWQCSSSVINFAFTKKQKYNMSIFKQYSYVFNKLPQYVQRTVNILDNSHHNFIYSHFGDSSNPPEIQEKYSWIKPYHKIGKTSINCQHNIVAAFIKNNKNIINKIKNYQDVVVFSEFYQENYNKILLKNIYDEQEYYCNLQNSKYFICEGQSTFLSDAFYNGKRPFVLTNYDDFESIMNSTISEKLNFSDNLSKFTEQDRSFISNINSTVQYLHEKIDEFCMSKNI